MGAGKSFADVVRANLGQKDRGQATPLVGTQVASKPGEPLELFKEGVKLSHNTPHHAPRKEIRSCKTTKNCSSENIIVCNNRFEPLMEENFSQMTLICLNVKSRQWTMFLAILDRL